MISCYDRWDCDDGPEPSFISDETTSLSFRPIFGCAVARHLMRLVDELSLFQDDETIDIDYSISIVSVSKVLMMMMNLAMSDDCR